MIWFWWLLKLSILLSEWKFFLHNRFLLKKNLVYRRFARTTSSWCTHDVNLYDVLLLCVQFICWWAAHAVDERVTQESSEISLRQPWNSKRTVILRGPYANRKCSVRFQTSEGNCGDCFAWQTNTLGAYGNRTSFRNCKMH